MNSQQTTTTTTKSSSEKMDSSEDTAVPTKNVMFPFNIANIQNNNTTTTTTTNVFNINIHTSSSTTTGVSTAAASAAPKTESVSASIGVGTVKDGTLSSPLTAATAAQMGTALDPWASSRFVEAEKKALEGWPVRLRPRVRSNIVYRRDRLDENFDNPRLMCYPEDVPEQTLIDINQLVYHMHGKVAVSRAYDSTSFLGSESILRDGMRAEPEKAAIGMEDLHLKLQSYPLPAWYQTQPVDKMGDFIDRFPAGFNNSDLAYLLVNCLVRRRPIVTLNDARRLYLSGIHVDFGQWLPPVRTDKLSDTPELPAFKPFQEKEGGDDDDEDELHEICDVNDGDDDSSSSPPPPPRSSPTFDIKAPSQPQPQPPLASLPKEMLVHPALPDALLNQVIYVNGVQISSHKQVRTSIPANTVVTLRVMLDLQSEFRVTTPTSDKGSWLAVNWSGNKQQLIAQILLSPSTTSVSAHYTRFQKPAAVGRLWLIATSRSNDYSVVFIPLDTLSLLYNSMLTHVFTAEKPLSSSTNSIPSRIQLPTIKLSTMHKIKEAENQIHKLSKTKAGQTASSSSTDGSGMYRIQEIFTNHPEMSAPALFFAASWYSWFGSYLSYIFERHFRQSWGKEDIVKFIRNPNWVTKFTIQHYNSIPILICMAAGYGEDEFKP